MIDPRLYLQALSREGVSFFTGVPDSLLKDFCACVTETIPQENHVISANEGAAISLAIGHQLGSGGLPIVYLQNSGLGNVINPILSLASAHVYGVPMLLLIGWRGEPGVKDEPQHAHQGQAMLPMLNAMEIPTVILSDQADEAVEQTARAAQKTKHISAPVAIVVRKKTFEKYSTSKTVAEQELTREEAIITAAGSIEKDALIVATTGMASRELFEFRANNKMGHHRDFLTVGGMGHASQIALGLAMSQPCRSVYCFDGDGAALMHMGSMAISGQSGCENFIHIVFNNGVHGSVGGQPTVGFKINFCQVADACGYTYSSCTMTPTALRGAIDEAKGIKGPSFIEVQTLPDNREEVGRPTSSPKGNKIEFMKYLGVV